VRRWPKRASSLALGTLVLIVGIMIGRAAFEADQELAAAVSSRQSDQTLRAVEHYRRVLRWSFPLSPYTEKAISGLEDCAAEFEASGHLSDALLAWRSLLGGLSATRVPYLTVRPSAARAKAQIARLEAIQTESPVGSGAALEQQIAEYRRELEVQVAPDPLWGTLLLLGFAAWVASLDSVARTGFDEEGRFRWTSARASLWSAIAGFVAFIVGLAFA
jgi:hypothetical protein